MKTITVKIDDSIFVETEVIISKIKTTRNKYINDALDFYNKIQRRKIMENKLQKESSIVQSDSLAVIYEFEKID